MIERPLEPQEGKVKCYKFKGVAACIIEGFVWAETAQEAIELAYTGGYEEIDSTIVDEIIEIDEVKEY